MLLIYYYKWGTYVFVDEGVKMNHKIQYSTTGGKNKQ